MTRRRDLLAAAAALLASRWAAAQSPGRVAKLGILSPNRPPKGMQNPLTRHGWKVGETLMVEFPDAGGSEERLSELAVELVRKEVDVIWANGPDAALAAARATSTIPIVFWGVVYPVEQGLIDSFARPGRNVTGIAFTSLPESDAKRLELLREIAPSARRLAFLSVAKVGGGATRIAIATRKAAERLGYEVREFEIEKPQDLESIFGEILQWRADALMTQPSTLINREREPIIAFANRNKLPSVFTLPDYVDSGGLVAYAIDAQATIVRSFDYVDSILRGANPAELPVDLPTKYVLAVNLRTAKALGLTVPQSVLLRADRVIE